MPHLWPYLDMASLAPPTLSPWHFHLFPLAFSPWFWSLQILDSILAALPLPHQDKITPLNEPYPQPPSMCYGPNCIYLPPKFICWSSNPPDFRMWLHLEVGSLETSLRWGHWMGPNPMWLVSLLKGEFGQSQKCTEGRWGEDRGRRWPSTSQSQRPGATLFSQPSEGTKPAHPLILDIWIIEMWDNTFLLFKLPNLWYSSR